ncbi:MAG: hypothetical protein ABIS23_06215 [Sphingomicrobium sp.]
MLSLSFLAAAILSAAQPGQVLGAWGSWAAIDRGSSCEAVSRAARPATISRPAAVAGFRFVPDRRQWGQFHVALSRIPRAGTSIVLDIGGQQFLLVGRGRDAWSRGTVQDQAIIEALRRGGTMKAGGRDESGRRFTDFFETRGAPNAVDSAAARCALRGAGKMR